MHKSRQRLLHMYTIEFSATWRKVKENRSSGNYPKIQMINSNKIQVSLWASSSRENQYSSKSIKETSKYDSCSWCIMCRENDETADHPFLHCSEIPSLWDNFWGEIKILSADELLLLCYWRLCLHLTEESALEKC